MHNIDPTYEALEQPLPEGWHVVWVGLIAAPNGFTDWRDSDAARGDFRLFQDDSGFAIGFSDPDTAFDFRMRFT